MGCAFEYGTHANTPPHNDHSLLKNELDAHPVGQTLEVWAVKSQDLCVVGFGDLEDLVEWEEMDRAQLPLYFGALLASSLVSCMLAIYYAVVHWRNTAPKTNSREVRPLSP